MKEFKDKLIERLEEWSFETEIVIPGSDGYDDTENREIICTKNAIEIVNQLADEYAKDQNWQTTRNYLDEKYFSKIRELSAKYNHPCENVPINFDWVFGLIEKIEKTAAVEDSGWIPCSERLPEVETDVFICTKQNGIAIASLSKPDIFWTDEEGFHILDVIAWQPLPAPYQPKGE